MNKNKEYYINNDLKSQMGSRESCEVYTVTEIRDGKTELVITKSISERYKLNQKNYDKVMDLYDRLTCGIGRKVWSLEEIDHPYNPIN